MIVQRLIVISAAGVMVLGTGGIVHAEDSQTCTATGKGTTWSLSVSASAAPLGGYVAGFPGGTITAFSIPGYSGQPDTTGLPPGTSNGLFTQIPSGRPVVLDVITSSPPTGPFTVAPINQAQTGYGPSFACPFGSGDGLQVAVGDVNGDGTPDLVITAPGAGTITIGSAQTKKRLVKSRKTTVSQAGEVTVPLRATSAGKARLAKDGSFTTRVTVTHTAADGTTTNKTVSVTFRSS